MDYLPKNGFVSSKKEKHHPISAAFYKLLAYATLSYIKLDLMQKGHTTCNNHAHKTRHFRNERIASIWHIPPPPSKALSEFPFVALIFVSFILHFYSFISAQ